MAVSYNPIRIQRSIQVTNVLSVYRFESLKPGTPYDEQYPFWQVTFLLSGEATYTTQGQNYPFRTGEVVSAGRSGSPASASPPTNRSGWPSSASPARQWRWTRCPPRR